MSPTAAQVELGPSTSWRAKLGERKVQRSQGLTGRLWWLVLSVAAMLPLALAEYPPLYDYAQWVFQGHVAGLLLRGGPESQAAASLYALSWSPIPNLASAAGIGLLSVWLPPQYAGRTFLAGCVLLFAGAFAYLVRGNQRHPTAVELLGFTWAFGYFMYNGFIGYLFSIPVSLIAIGTLHRITSSAIVTPRDAFTISLLGVFLYLCHLLGWVIYLASSSVYVLIMLWQRRLRDFVIIAATFIPSLIMLGWYVSNKRGNNSVELYESLPNKLASLAGPLLPFLRTDPFEPVVPIPWANVVVLVAVGGVVLLNLERPVRANVSRPLLAAAALLGTFALVMPFSWFGGLGRPDERFTLPALLVALAAFRYKRVTAVRGASVGCVVLLVLGLHLVEYRRASQALADIQATTAAAIPPDAPVLSIAVHEPPLRAACDRGPDVSLGVPSLQWFALYRLAGTGRLRANTFETSLIASKFDEVGPLDLRMVEMTPEQVRADAPLGPGFAPSYAFIQVFGCPDDIFAVRQALTPEYAVAAGGAGFEVLRREQE